MHNQRDLTDTERLAHLQSCLTGEASDAVSGLLCDGSQYVPSLRELECLFGSPRHVVRAALNRLMAAPPARENDLRSLGTISTALHSAVMVLSQFSYDADLAATSNLRQVVSKLPRALAWRWGEHVTTLRPANPTLADLDRWLRGHIDAGRLVSAEDVNGPPAPAKTSKEPAQPAIRPRRYVLSATKRPTLEMTCDMCGGAHLVTDCPKFKAASISDRADVVKEKCLCWSCLRSGHQARQCPDKAPCDAAPGCKGRHHPLLHGAPRLFRPTATPRDDTDQTYVGATKERPCTTVLLQILPVTVRGPSGRRVVNALLDLGSQVSLMTEQLAIDLGVNGPSEPLRLGTVACSLTHVSKRVELQVKAKEGDATEYLLKDVRTTPILNVTSSTLNWPKEKVKWPHLADLNLGKIAAHPVELLIGADAIELIAPMEVRQGPAGSPWAVRTRLGWVATGKLPQSVVESRACHVNTIKMEEADLYEKVTNWWTTQSFGTKYQRAPRRSKQDEPTGVKVSGRRSYRSSARRPMRTKNSRP